MASIPIILNTQMRHRSRLTALPAPPEPSMAKVTQGSSRRESSARLGHAALAELQSRLQEIGAEEDGRLKLENVFAYLTTKFDPPWDSEDVREMFDPLIQGQPLDQILVTIEEIHEALTSDTGMQLIKQRTRDLASVMTRDDLVRSIASFTDRNDALMTLPITMAYIFIFLVLVVGHLDISERQSLENAMEAWVNGRDPRTSCSESVDSTDAFWEWFLSDSDGLAGLFLTKRTSAHKGSAQYVLANRNILLGDVQLTLEKEGAQKASVWLIHSPAGQEHLQNLTQRGLAADYLGMAQAAARHLKVNERWNDPAVTNLQVSFITYNEMANMFALTHVRVRMGEHGDVSTMIKSKAMRVQPYPASDWHICVFDALYVVIVVYTMHRELRDLYAAARLGCGEFLDYWAFSNVVDWICIVLGLANIAIWAICCVKMLDDRLHSLLQGSKLQVDAMALDSDSLTRLMGMLRELMNCYVAMQILMALNTLSIIMRFFKAFNANPRLRVVTDTFAHAIVDFAHFGIIFVTIFVPFGIIGHVLFGNDIPEFKSIVSSFNTGMQVMMGDFGWYTELMASKVVEGSLPSGLPVILVTIWYILYMFVVLLVLLNMLLAIIIEHYTQVLSTLSQLDNPPLWHQVISWMRYKKETRKFISLEELRRGLENDAHPVHPETDVNLASLVDAWPAMNKAQALWLLRFVRRGLTVQHAPAPTSEDLKELLLSHCQQLDELSSSVERVHKAHRRARGPAPVLQSSRSSRVPRRGDKCASMTRRRFRQSGAARLKAAKPQQLEQPTIEGQILTKISARLDELTEGIIKLRRDQAGLARRVEDLRGSVEASRADDTAMKNADHDCSGHRPENPTDTEAIATISEGSALNSGRHLKEAEPRRPPDRDRDRDGPRQSGVGTKLRDRENQRRKEDRARARGADRGGERTRLPKH